MEKKRTCKCLRDCPCYPDCDRMMEEGRMPGGIPESWRRTADPFEPGPQMQNLRRAPWNAGDGQAGWTGPAQDALTLAEENERDWRKLKEQYPDMARIILEEVENVCDSMEYEGSAMFDTIPDKVRVRRLTEEIYEKVKDRYPVEESPDADDMFAMNQEGRRRYPPGQNWLSDFIQVLLYQEMFHRRCRHRGCRRW